MKLKELLGTINAVANKNNIATPFLCGGVVRDKVIGILGAKKLNDIDITNGESSIKNLATEVELELSKQFSIQSKIMNDGHMSIFLGKLPNPVLKIDFSSNYITPNIDNELKKIGISNIDNMTREIYSRDFNCNSLIMDFDFKKITDITNNGIEDIKNKIIRTCLSPEITLINNLNRIIRVIYFSTKLDFSIDPAILEFISKNKNLISGIDTGYITKTLNKSFLYNKEKTNKILNELELWNSIPINEKILPYYQERFSKQAQLRKNFDYGEGFYSNIQNIDSIKDFKKKRKKKRKKEIKKIRDMKLASNQQKCLTNVLRLLKKDPTLIIKMGPADKGYDTRHFWAEDNNGKIIDPTRSDYPYYNKGIIFDLDKNNIDIKKLNLSLSESKLNDLLNDLRNEFSTAAQKILDAWEQNENQFDEVFGYGGPCDEISMAISGIISQHNIDTIEGGQPGDDHAFTIAYDDNEAYGIDVPHSLYEIGRGYSWKKIKDIKIQPSDIDIWKINRKDLGEIEKLSYYNGQEEYLKDNFPTISNEELETSLDRKENNIDNEDNEEDVSVLEPTPYSPEMFYAMHGIDGLYAFPLSAYPGHPGEEETEMTVNDPYNPLFQSNGLFESLSFNEIANLFVKLSVNYQ